MIKAVGKYKIPKAHIAIPKAHTFAIDTVDNKMPKAPEIIAKAKIANIVFLSVFTNSRLRQTRPNK